MLIIHLLEPPFFNTHGNMVTNWGTYFHSKVNGVTQFQAPMQSDMNICLMNKAGACIIRNYAST